MIQHNNHYYAHRIVLPDGSVFKFSDTKENTAQELSRGVTISGSLADTTSTVSVGTVPQNASGVKAKLSLITDTLDPNEIIPANAVTDEAKYAYLVKDFRENDYDGRPVVVWEKPDGN